MSGAHSRVQTPAHDHTKGPVGISGTVMRSVIGHTEDGQITLTSSICCNGITCNVTQQFGRKEMTEAVEWQHRLAPGAHMTAFGEAPNFQLRDGELHLQTNRVITYQLKPDAHQVGEPDLFASA